MAGRYDFVSPGAEAGNAIQQFLVQRELLARQQQMDEFKRQQQAAESERQQAELQLKVQQEARAAAHQQQADDLAATAQRAKTNAEGVRGMIADRIDQGPIAQPEAQTIAGMAYREGVSVPGVIATALQPPKRSVVETVDAKGNPIRKAVTEDELVNGVPAYVKPETPSDQKQPYQWVVRNGQQVYTNSVQPGDVPASRSGGGRSVSSADAGRISDLDQSLNDLATLTSTLGETSSSTGPMASVGAALPNVITSVTGIGTEAKQRQGVIDRVKQVIGKALEGGVLRKEDEEKYAKILPTISDPPDVAASKLEGLRKALIQKRSTFLGDLENAGFDVSKYPSDPNTTSMSGVVKWGRDAQGRPVRLQ